MKKRSRIAIAAIGGTVVVLGGAYLTAHFVAGEQVPARAEVDGVMIGGLAPDQAVEKLRSELGPKVDEPITVSAGDRSVSIIPSQSGLTADFDATVADAGGGSSWNPALIVHSLLGGGPVDLVRNVDESSLNDAVVAQASTFAVPGTPATVGFEAGKVVRTPAAQAEALNVEATSTAVSDAFREGAVEAEATIDSTDPDVTDAMVDEVVSTFAEPLVSGPVTLTHNDTSMQITAEQLAEAATFEKVDGALVGRLDADALFESTAEAQKALKLTPTKDASFAFSGSEVVVVPAVVGEALDKDSFAAGVEKAATATGDGRTAPVEVVKGEPEFTTEQAESLGTFTKIGSFTTSYPHAAYRNKNLGRASELVNGTVLMPDEIFSLNDALGERTAANGFTDGYVINGGRLVKESGGGISQAATTLFNAAFFAGFKDIEHKPHSLYFDRYPAGRESTIYYGSLDMRFQNDTEFPAIIRGYINPSSSGNKGSLTFEIWSKPTYDKIVSTDIVKSGFYSGTTRTITGDPTCEPQAPIQGFTATWKRLFYLDGEVVREEPNSWTYNAGDRIVCD
ncbi:Putative peptidoglycan binding domain-containing protein [Tessaracoccus bendigoensis DSM 12906]|uniref:Putative peptidoglycan binding domain-containing protein n=1 Tax=Tessaracoccus bendigoensis DSM 12906 TaxID=1123357 RepID=A0A1M6F002_9ACTN|nr:VanW family protein [Tessaracoccus bendigoensis]SHI91017.1 Putative peptidoglycan binding domain-containing protein [Tessaracoccus bendigoensis DSM 12906]